MLKTPVQRGRSERGAEVYVPPRVAVTLNVVGTDNSLRVFLERCENKAGGRFQHPGLDGAGDGVITA